MALHGTCWKHHDGVIEDAANWELKKEQNHTINPLTVSCRDHRRCKEFDINMICPLNVKKCRCRPLVGMRWNPAEAECQVYVVSKLGYQLVMTSKPVELGVPITELHIVS